MSIEVESRHRRRPSKRWILALAPPTEALRRLRRHEHLAPLILGSVLTGAMLHALLGNLPWLLPFFRDFFRWLIDPAVAGGPSAPARWVAGLLIYAAAFCIGGQLSWLIYKDTVLANSRAAVGGTALIIGPCSLGVLATLAEVTGLLYQWVLGVMLATVMVVSTLAWLRARARCKGTIRVGRTFRSSWERVDVVLWSLVAVVVVITFIHVAMSPITEWDAIVYHAGTAKLWFDGRPDPPLVYGPSVGIEISANYPPLFPATGAFFDVLLNRFADFYLRVLPPIVLLGMLLSVHAYADGRYGRSVARWTVIMMLGCPLLVMYGSWPTGYIYLVALTTLGIILIDFAVESGRRATWVWAGVVGGLACLTSFYGAMLVVIAAIAVLVFGRWRLREERRAFFGYLVAVVVVFLPWGLRNTLLLGDPVYPLLSPPFSAKGLVQPFWSSAQSEVRDNSLGYWTSASRARVHLGMRLQELATACFDRNLPSSGTLFGALAGWRFARRGERRSLFLVLALLALIGVQLLPGWYWLRALLYATPIASLLAARGIVFLLGPAGHGIANAANFVARRPVLGLAVHWKRAAGISLATVACTTAVSLAVIGTATPTWPTSLNSFDDMMKAVRDLGSTSETLNYVFPGDYQAWQWLNAHTGAKGRVATVDNRLYYYSRPSELFYLDGREAAPLLRLRTGSAVIRFFRERGIHYIFLPAWATAPGPAEHPILKLLPFVSLLGGRDFPVAVFFPIGPSEIGQTSTTDMIYHVGPLRRGIPTSARVAFYPGIRSEFSPLPIRHNIVVAADDASPRLYVRATSIPELLEIRYRQTGSGYLGLNVYDASSRRWIYDTLFRHKGALGWTRVSVPVIPSGRLGTEELGLYAATSSIEVRSIRLVRATRAILAAPHGAAGVNGVTIEPHNEDFRLVVPAGGQPVALSLTYKSGEPQRLDINEQDSRGVWHYDVVPFTTNASGRWTRVTLGVSADGGPFARLGIYAPTSRIVIRDPTWARLRSPLVDRLAPFEALNGHVLAAGAKALVTLSAPAGRRSVLSLTLRTLAAGTVTVKSLEPGQGTPSISLPETFRSAERRTIVLPDLSGEDDGLARYTVSGDVSTIVRARETVGGTRYLLDDSDGAVVRTSTATVLAATTDSRLFIPSERGQQLSVSFTYRSAPGSGLEWNQDCRRWRLLRSFPASPDLWRRARITMPAASPITQLGLHVLKGYVEVRDIAVTTKALSSTASTQSGARSNKCSLSTRSCAATRKAKC